MTLPNCMNLLGSSAKNMTQSTSRIGAWTSTWTLSTSIHPSWWRDSKRPRSNGPISATSQREAVRMAVAGTERCLQPEKPWEAAKWIMAFKNNNSMPPRRPENLSCNTSPCSWGHHSASSLRRQRQKAPKSVHLKGPKANGKLQLQRCSTQGLSSQVSGSYKRRPQKIWMGMDGVFISSDSNMLKHYFIKMFQNQEYPIQQAQKTLKIRPFSMQLEGIKVEEP